MNNQKSLSKGLAASAWLAYTVIVFEILYMISPFALYYYSLYAPPLRWLQSHEATAFLTLSILPHFSHQSSIVISVLQLIAWPMILIGLILFLIGFLQIYWAKLRGTGNVSGGLYRVIRHPQYAALALVGLGCTIYWPRFIVFLMYATMLFLYYFLAKSEEERCLQRFGESYQKYLDRTGMFLPKTLGNKLPRIPALLPKAGAPRIFALLAVYVLYMGIVAAAGFAVRDFALSRITAICTDDQAAVSVAPLEKEKVAEAIRIVTDDLTVQSMLANRVAHKLLLYVVPQEWNIPELGLKGAGHTHDVLGNPGSHGNSSRFNRDSLVVLITKPILATPEARGEDIVKNSLSFDPILEVLVDVKQNSVVKFSKRMNRGKWDGIPVPIF
ncbi:MAG: isoprenylcysteine carboxylmethyltransferase family protein [candidate division KSB1 bacterium]|nr:isoprenylcysteine carboxylmethyltransferase family protein [candidate division KSB1 bacterium]MDZ7302716.1 isoprenylcysteine carboxylmethyltransferase family protein [candidate division KSB1 bacterium]MDZ7311753.1 isoprenylcysteine carboxylmethyltransferase family protein [candidate division KSB1 bacterium]